MLTQELPVYRDCYEMINVCIGLTRSYHKTFKYTIGQKIIDTSLSLFECIQLANVYKTDRVKHLTEFLVRFELLKMLIRLSFDNKLISLKQFSNLVAKNDRIGKQITAWKSVSV